MKRFLLLFFLPAVTAFCPAQKQWSVQEVIERAEQYHARTKEYSYDLEYRFFKNELSREIIEQYAGRIIRKEDVVYQKINAAESVSFIDCLVTVNPAEKVLFVAKRKNNGSPVLLKQLLKMSKTSKLTQDKEHWICELTAAQERSREFTKAVIYIHKKDFSLNRQIFYTEGTQEIEKKGKVMLLKKPRLEISYRANPKALAGNVPKLSKSYYFSIKNNKVTPSGRFQKYTLITQ